jgi:hypothetical protein
MIIANVYGLKDAGLVQKKWLSHGGGFVHDLACESVCHV